MSRAATVAAFFIARHSKPGLVGLLAHDDPPGVLRHLIVAQRIHHLLGFSQAAAVEFAGGVNCRDVLAADDEFVQLLLLVFAAERFQVREVLL